MKVVLKKQIHGCFASASSGDIWLTRECNLPFAPYPGLIITDKDLFEAKIEEVAWDEEDQQFTAYTEADKTIYHAKLNHQEHDPIEDIVKEWVEGGWEVAKL